MSSHQVLRQKRHNGWSIALFRQGAVLLRYLRLRFLARLQSPLWRFIRGQHEVAEGAPQSSPEKKAPVDPVAAPAPKPVPEAQGARPLDPTHEDLQQLLSEFQNKQNRHRKTAGKRAKEGGDDHGQMEIQFDDHAKQPEVVAPAKPSPPPPPPAPYQLPGLDLFRVENITEAYDKKEIIEVKGKIQKCLEDFRLDATVGEERGDNQEGFRFLHDESGAIRGPQVTQYRITVGKGVKTTAISSLENELKMALASESLRILAPVSGHDYAGIEVPNRHPDPVLAGNLFASSAWTESKALLPLIVGKDIEGKNIVTDLARAPHLLVAGTTGSGKSVLLNSFIVSLVKKFTPDELQLLLIDPKFVEMQAYNRLPHLVVPVINDAQLVALALRWVEWEMDRRYRLLTLSGARNIESFNARPPSSETTLDEEGNPLPDKLPWLVVVIDELADLMSVIKSEIETSIARIVAKARAAGIHLITATQRPSVDVITGTIKSNFPSRIAFRVSTQVDSRTILDHKGAEALLGRGDMIFNNNGSAKRIQGAMITDPEIERVVDFCAAQRQPPESGNYECLKVAAPVSETANDGQASAGEREDILWQAAEIIITDRKPSISYLQRKLNIGYNNAAKLMEELEKHGVVGPQPRSGSREILLDSTQDLENALGPSNAP